MKKWFYVLMAAIVTTAMVACSDDDPAQGEQGGNENEGGSGGNEQVETEKVSAEDLMGHWQCSFQQWTTGENNRNRSYEVEKDIYYLKFLPSMKGAMGSDENELLGIDAGRVKTFNWSVSDGKISMKEFPSSPETEWLVEKLSENAMTLSCQVGDEKITCNFQRNTNRGVYTPMTGDKVTRIRKYNLRNGETMERVENYEYEYDDQNRIKTVRHKVNGSTYTTTYEYVEDTIRINDNDIILIGKNGYIRYDRQYDYLHVGERTTAIVHDEEGYLSKIEYIDDPLIQDDGVIEFKYSDRGFEYTLESFYEDDSVEFGYNIEVPNNTSLNLPATYIYGAYYFNLFDFYGKRMPYVINSVGNSWYNFELDMEHNGRVSKITKSDNISPDVWEIYYED